MDEILAYYAGGAEVQRLQRGIGLLELARTQEILKRVLPPPPGVVYDVGGGVGVYSFWLARQGYTVHLLELTPENVAWARQAAVFQPDHPLAALDVADGRALPRPPESADVVLVMGPLYHLTERGERLQALREAWRVLKPGGRLVCSAISRYGSTLWGLTSFGQTNDCLSEVEFMEMIVGELRDGQHIRPARYPAFIARSFFHLPDELAEEVRAAGFTCEQVLAVEGPGWVVPEFARIWQEPDRRAPILRVVQLVEDDPAIKGISPHLLAVGYKPGGV